MPMRPPASSDKRPTVDEWGMYDPERAGLSALYARLSATRRPAPGEQPETKAGKPASSLPGEPEDR